VFVKKYRVSRAGQLWSGLWRGTFFGRSKVRREFGNLTQLREWGMHAPEPVAWGEVRCWGFVVRSFLVTESVPAPVVSLDRFIRDMLPALPPDEGRACRRELVERLAQVTRRLHEHRFVHGDLYWRNILLARGGRLDAFYLIDAHASRRWKAGEGAWHRAADLGSLDAPAPWFFSRADRLRFLLRYLGRRRIEDAQRDFVRKILAVAEPLRARQLKRVQQLRG
jgi:tRNA A-37 threonylcarbamoyl transferase component Bud32